MIYCSASLILHLNLILLALLIGTISLRPAPGFSPSFDSHVIAAPHSALPSTTKPRYANIPLAHRANELRKHTPSTTKPRYVSIPTSRKADELRKHTSMDMQMEQHSECSSSDISISQGQEGVTRGIPEFVVEIVNTCYSATVNYTSAELSGRDVGDGDSSSGRNRSGRGREGKRQWRQCDASEIHVHCGWFASAPLVNPALFRRLAFDDCLVNAGLPLPFGHILRFHYANSFMYPLRLKSVKFCP